MTSVVVADRTAMHALGERLASQLVAGDLVVLAGSLGAGKTTLTQGLGRGLQVRGDVTSPTFVIARVHPSTVGGPALVHVDAYRLDSALEVDDLDLDASLEESITVVEWGAGKVEGLAEDRLVVEIVRRTGGEPAPDAGSSSDSSSDRARCAGESRTVTLTGPRAEMAGRRPRLRRRGGRLMLVLGIDTSSAVVVASLSDGTGVLASSTRPGAQAHGELLAPGIDEVLRASGRAPDDLTHVVVGVGPGPFTGLRVGIVTALVLGEALTIPVLGVCSLDVVAALAVGASTAASRSSPTPGARRSTSRATTLIAGRLTAPVVARPADLDEAVRVGPVVGAGAALYPDRFSDVRSTEPLAPVALAGVATAVVLGSSAYEVLDPTPMYLRRPDAVENAGRKRVTQS